MFGALANAPNPPDEVVCVVVVAGVVPNPVFPNAGCPNAGLPKPVEPNAVCPKAGCVKPLCPNPDEVFDAFVVGEPNAFTDDAGLLFVSKAPLEVSPVKAPKPVAGLRSPPPPKVDDGSVWLEAVDSEPKEPNILLTALESVDVALPSDNPPNPGVSSDMEAS